MVNTFLNDYDMVCMYKCLVIFSSPGRVGVSWLDKLCMQLRSLLLLLFFDKRESNNQSFH